jgi:hypothetical protein
VRTPKASASVRNAAATTTNTGSSSVNDDECNGICLYGADLGVPEYGGVAYAHPDCPAHGDPLEEWEDIDVSIPGYDEGLRYVREENMELS